MYEIGKHGYIEHDASLVHEDTPPGQVYAPTEVKPDLVELLIKDATDTSEAEKREERGEDQQVKEYKTLLGTRAVAQARVRREKQSPQLDKLHALIACGEIAVALGILEIKEGTSTGVPVEWVREWMGEERFPTGWQPTHVQGLIQSIKRTKAVRKAMEEVKKIEASHGGQ